MPKAHSESSSSKKQVAQDPGHAPDAFAQLIFDGIRSPVIMPIRISCRDKPLHRVQLIEYIRN
jgi:hypothetical protein